MMDEEKFRHPNEPDEDEANEEFWENVRKWMLYAFYGFAALWLLIA
jgi:hypothetical protein